MATIGTKLTLLDYAKRLDPNGKIDAIAELLAQTNEILADMPFVEGNLQTGHKTTVRTGLPSATWRQLNYGVQPTKSTTKQVTDACGMLEAYSEIDKALADLNGNSAEFRLSEDRAFLEAMNQEMATTLFYGDTTTDPEKFNGLECRYNVYSATRTNSGSNIIKSDGSGEDSCTSIWLVVWGPNTAHGIFPKGSKAGLVHEDLGEQTLLDASGGKYQGYRTHYKWDIGLTVRDWRYVVRIANIKVSALTASGSTGSNLIDLMSQALELPPNLSMGTPVFYCNRDIKSYLRRQINNKSNLHLTLDQVADKHVVAFDSVPVRRVDSILNTESVIA